MNHNEAVDHTLNLESQLAQHKATIDRLEEELREIKQQLSKVTVEDALFKAHNWTHGGKAARQALEQYLKSQLGPTLVWIDGAVHHWQCKAHEWDYVTQKWMLTEKSCTCGRDKERTRLKALMGDVA